MAGVLQKNTGYSVVHGVQKDCLFVQDKVGIVGDAVRNGIAVLELRDSAVAGTQIPNIIGNFYQNNPNKYYPQKKLRISNKEEHTCLSKEKQQESEANRQGLQQIPECVKIDTASCCLFYLPPEVGTDLDN